MVMAVGGGGEMLKEFLFLLVAYDRGNGKTEKEFFNPSNVASFNCS
jgi:hypothetical protein